MYCDGWMNAKYWKRQLENMLPAELHFHTQEVYNNFWVAHNWLTEIKLYTNNDNPYVIINGNLQTPYMLFISPGKYNTNLLTALYEIYQKVP